MGFKCIFLKGLKATEPKYQLYKTGVFFSLLSLNSIQISPMIYFYCDIKYYYYDVSIKTFKIIL
jgi:hypothetical protein